MPVLKMIEHNMRKSAHVVYKIFAAFENSFIIAFFSLQHMKRPLFLINGVNDVKITELHFHGKKHLMPKGQVEKRPSKNHFLQNVILKSMSFVIVMQEVLIWKRPKMCQKIYLPKSLVLQ